MAWATLTEYLARERIQGREQRGRSVTFVIVRHGFATAFLQRQTGLRPIQRLNLAFLVNRKHDRLLRRVEIQPDNVFQLLDELRIAADLKDFHPMGFQSVRLPNPSYARRTDTQHMRHASGAPVRRIVGLLSGGLPNDFFGINLAHSAGPRSILLDPR